MTPDTACLACYDENGAEALFTGGSVNEGVFAISYFASAIAHGDHGRDLHPRRFVALTFNPLVTCIHLVSRQLSWLCNIQ